MAVAIVITLKIVYIDHHETKGKLMLQGPKNFIPYPFLVITLNIKARKPVRNLQLNGLPVKRYVFQRHRSQVAKVGKQPGVILAKSGWKTTFHSYQTVNFISSH